MLYGNHEHASLDAWWAHQGAFAPPATEEDWAEYAAYCEGLDAGVRHTRASHQGFRDTRIPDGPPLLGNTRVPQDPLPAIRNTRVSTDPLSA
jgi:hypothetical protein